LKLFLFGNSMFAILFALIATNTVAQHRHALETVGHDAAPSVVAAHEIQIGALQMDGRLADELLTSDKEIGKLMAADFEKGRTLAAVKLVAAAKNITYGQSEQEPIENIQVSIGAFEMQSQRARDLNISGVMPDEIVGAYRTACDTMSKVIVPNTNALNKANRDVLEDIYASEKSRSALTCGFVLLLGIVLLCLLGTTQFYLRKTFRRRLNIPLVVASFLTVVFITHLNSEVRESAERLKKAKEDSYDSIFALLSAQSSIYAANAAQSRFLLDPARSARYQKEFDDSLRSIVSFAPGHDFAGSITWAEKELHTERQCLNVPGLTGTLADEFANVEYPGEGKAALETLVALEQFVDADRRMRELERAGNHAEAIKVCMGYEPGRVKSAFEQFNEALGRGLAINQEHFDLQIISATDDLKGLGRLSQMFAIVIILCVYLGLSPRLREYM